MVIKWYIKSIIQDFRQPVSYLIPAIILSGCIVFAVSWLYGKKSTIKHRILFSIFLAYILVIFRVVFLMTYHEDVATVKDSFKKMLENGVYKADLFSDL